MKAYTSDKIKNIAVLGHGGKGKTTLCEAMLYIAGATDRMGKVADGNTVLDFDAEEKKRKTSISTSMAAIEWDGYKLNILDTPGLFDFENSKWEAVRAAETILVVTSAGSDLDVGTEKAVKAAIKEGKKIFFAITKTDSDHRSFYKTFDALKEAYGTKLCPTVVPYMEGTVTKSYVNFISDSAFAYNNEKGSKVDMPSDSVIDDMKATFKETVASADDALMEKFFEDEEFTHDEIINGLKEGINQGSIYPVIAVAGLTGACADQLLNVLAWAAPSAADAAAETALSESDEEIEVACDAAAPLAAICFKTIADPFVGKMSFFKVVSGRLAADVAAYNMRTGDSEKLGKIVTVKGAKQEDAKEIPAGDIGVITKLANVKTGDTLCDPKRKLTLKPVFSLKPCLSMAVKVRKKGEDEKAAQAINKLKEEDPSISYEMNKETKEQILSGLGDQHLDVIVSKLKDKFGVEIDLENPKVAYRETIRSKTEVQGKYKKQSGGHGQYGDVWIRFEPCDSDELVFAEEVFGGAVPKNYFPAVEKGLQESVKKGVLAGYPMVGVKATLYDGSYHPVDSSEMAFKSAANVAYKDGIPKANPTILEPIGTLVALMPDDKLGDIMGDVTKRRGRVLGMGPAEEPKMQELTAEVPMANMSDFTTVLRSVTAGRGSFTFEFTRYEQAPQDVIEKVIEEAKKEEE
ncbi:MAG: elongation factor G [Clostridiales bacterium]|nr:elongation factor G [Clostridiales bacterium]